jgi:CBS domain-containing protein
MLVRDVMKSPVCVAADESLEAAIHKLKNDNVGCLPVCEDNQVLGIITDRDILMRAVGTARSTSKMTARDCMTVEVHCCLEGDTVEVAASVMAEKKMRRLPVLGQNGQLVGVVSQSDLSGGSSAPAHYEVVFYKELLGGYGHPHHVELKRVAVSPGQSKEAAIATAVKQVEKQNNTAWTNFATGYDVTEVRTDDAGKLVEEVERTTEKEARIRRRAYDLWERSGGPEGSEGGFWAEAERQIDTEGATAHGA